MSQKLDILVIPNYTLMGEIKSKQISFKDSMEKKQAEDLFNEFVNLLR